MDNRQKTGAGRRPRIRLRIGITLMFMAIMVPLTTLMTVVLYRQNVRLAHDLAQSAMDRATGEVVGGVRDLLVPMARMVDMSVAFAKENRGSLRKVASMRPLVDSLDAFPDIYSLYLGFAHDGAFFQAIRIPPPGTPGLRGLHPPPEARYALRLKDRVGGELVESYIYIAKWGEVVGVERAAEITYDPRQRPWYKSAEAKDGIATSGVYVFTSIGQPGLTLSRRLATDDGDLIGVFGADLSTRTLSTFLDGLGIGHDGVVFILDEDGRLIGYPHPERAQVQHGGQIEIAKAEDIADRVTADAVRLRRDGAGDRFRAQLGPDGQQFLVSFTPFPGDFGRGWTIGVIAAEEEFIAPLRRASIRILLIGFGFLSLASLAVLWASRVLTRPIHRLTAETARIQALDLAGDVDVQSSVIEIHALASGLTTMKAALRSFGTYVPKDLLRHIVRSGKGTEIGGVRQPVTIMFTDIQGFTQTSEFVPPEDVANHLSIYLELMSEAIGAHRGTIDKFIGDAVMAMWNAPAEDPDHVAHACAALLACRAASEQLNADLAANNFPVMPTRFGLHTGTAMVGNVGSSDRMQYTALGTAVNLASRVEGLNKRFSTSALVTGPVEEAVRGRFLFRALGPVAPAGMSAPVPLFELVAALEPGAANAADEATLARCRAWEKAFRLYEARDWPAATQAFGDYFRTYPGEKSGHMLMARSRAYSLVPPPADWDGAFRFDEK